LYGNAYKITSRDVPILLAEKYNVKSKEQNAGMNG